MQDHKDMAQPLHKHWRGLFLGEATVLMQEAPWREMRYVSRGLWVEGRGLGHRGEVELSPF